uniref:SHOCT domain-containing protein n=1 Tax=Staphylothermus marinus TaxID=2280 RepID=A0A7J3KFG6_STAMA
MLLRGIWNSFMDVRFPENVRELIMNRIVAWRKAFQQHRIVGTLERIADKVAPVSSISEELAKLKELLDKGIITKEEYEKAKKKILGE